MSAAYTITREGRNGRTWRERRVMQGGADSAEIMAQKADGSGVKWTCPRCSGRGTVLLPGLGRGGMNVGGLYRIECPSCKGGRINPTA